MTLQRYAIVDTSNNVVLTVVEYEDMPTTPPPGFVDGVVAIQNDFVGPDWTYDGTNFSPPVSPTIAPAIVPISDRQFFQQLAIQGIISQDEALSAVATGTIPSEMLPLINALPADQQFGAKMILMGATTFERNHPLTIAIGQAYGWSDTQIDQFFLAAALL